ncbi:MAG: ADP-forming succinate--CoA ligase subunit beta [Chloroflexi bacterium]|nr:ADP-forming succinate--CoA ligase subunit beta [Chloroflexota bacterium]
MKIHEYQAKQILAEFGVPVPKGRVATTPAEARQIAEELGGKVVVKAQIHAGGRGKGGGVKLANSATEAEQAASQILGMQLITHQTGPQGQKVKQVLVEEQSPIERELYLSIVLDNALAEPVLIASAAGGMDIEEVAATRPDEIQRVAISPISGLRPYQSRIVATALGFTGDQVRAAQGIMGGLYRAYQAKDASLVEINPLVVTADGRVMALDAKMNFDDNALYRHADVAAMRDKDEEDPLEVQAQDLGVNNYIKLDGNIGCIVNGAGLAMATMDVIKLAGGEPANFLDIGTVNDPMRVVNAFKIMTQDKNVKGVLVNIFGGMARTDIIAAGVVEAQKQMDLTQFPVVVRLAGTNLEEGLRILAESGLPIITADDLGEAAKKAVAAVSN